MKSAGQEGCGAGVQSVRQTRLMLLVPKGRLELPRAYCPLEPESSASANSATPARSRLLNRADLRLSRGRCSLVRLGVKVRIIRAIL
jgi:hypothetical protein